MERRKVRFVPGLFKIFDEIIVNAADNKQRDPSTEVIRVDVNPETNEIAVFNDGRGVPIVTHTTEKIPIPSLVFGHLLTGSNFDDSVAKVTGGRNGFGAKLTNIFSSRFTVETNDTQRKLHFRQTWTDNMSREQLPQITKSEVGSSDFTRVTFTPDLSRFGLSTLQDDDLLALMKRRTFDLAACNNGVRVYFNGELLPCSTFADYVKMFPVIPESMVFSTASDSPVEGAANRWEVGVGLSETGQFEHVSFVNSISTSRGGTHVQDVVDPLSRVISEKLSRKNAGGIPILPAHIRNHLFIFVRCLVQNPSFDSQTKETLITRPPMFGSRFKLTDSFVQRLLSTTRLADRILSWAQFRQQEELNSQTVKTERLAVLHGIPKLDDANLAGSARSSECTLILTEGDSAKALAVSGLSILGRDTYGVFPLKGKVLNVREATHEQLLKNQELSNLKQIIGLDHMKTYDSDVEFHTLRYGRVMLMTDQDNDGSHIKGLLINLFHYFWPALLRRPAFLSQFITPIVKARHGKKEKWFFNIPEYEQWRDKQKAAPGGLTGWSIKYYKGLGTSTSQEAKEYFSSLQKHQLQFQWQENDEKHIELAFCKSKADDRKRWIEKNFTNGLFLDPSSLIVTYNDFINREFILFSHADNVRSIPSLVDGLKPGQRKTLFACFKRNLKQEVKVAQLAGYISEQTGYHHGEASLHSTIVHMAQNFVGSNNLPLLHPGGQFGTRLQGGKDAASARYIFTKLNPLTRLLFPEADDAVLNYLEDDGFPIEPEHYVPLIPMILVNGTEGIGTGWSTSIPCYHPAEIIKNIKEHLAGRPMAPMTPWYAGFKGTIAQASEGRFISTGVVTKANQIFRITELPIARWTTDYKEFLESLCSSRKHQRYVAHFKEHHSDTTVDFSVSVTAAGRKMIGGQSPTDEQLNEFFKLSKGISTSNMHLFDHQGKLRLFKDPREIIESFVSVRLATYEQRKTAVLEKLAQDSLKLENRCRFAQMIVDGSLAVLKRPKSAIIEQLAQLGFATLDSDFSYLLNTSIFDLTEERIAKLQKEFDGVQETIKTLRGTSIHQLYEQELKELSSALDKQPSLKINGTNNSRQQSRLVEQ